MSSIKTDSPILIAFSNYLDRSGEDILTDFNPLSDSKFIIHLLAYSYGSISNG